jgi:hypothetical protein
MAVIFSSTPGVACVLNDPFVLPITFNFTGWGGYATRRAILQGITISSKGNYQFLHTLRNYVYVYVFGERMGDVQITGLTTMSECGTGHSSGISEVIRYYANNCISWTGAPVGIQIGFAAFWGFLVGIDIGTTNPESRIGRFTLTFNTIPT